MLEDKMTTLINAFFGPLFILILGFTIEWYRRQCLVISDINATIGILTVQLKMILTLKRDHVLPLKDAYDKCNEDNKLKLKKGEDFDITMPQHLCPELQFNLPKELIFRVAENFDVVQNISEAEFSVKNVGIMYQRWNELCKKFKEISDKDKKLHMYLGELYKGIHDSEVPDTLNALFQNVDEALHFINCSIRSLQDLGEKQKPSFHFKKNVVKFKLTCEESKLMPSDSKKDK